MKVYQLLIAALAVNCTSATISDPALDSGAPLTDAMAPLDANVDASPDVASIDASSIDAQLDATTDSGPSNVVIAAAGDISEDAIGQQQKTSDLIFGKGFDAVLLLGDNQYEAGSLSDYTKYYDPTWGRFKSITYPVPGNHEYGTSKASGYFSYFGASAGDATKGYYSFDLGAWHIVALNTNSECGSIGCNATSAQVAWLVDDLQKNTKKCTLAYWHHPRFNSGAAHGNFSGAQALWDALYAAGADVVLNGHEHIYERFDPQDPSGKADTQSGIRQFTVGTGGRNLYALGTTKANSAVRRADTYGILKMTLKADSYDWEFLPVAGSTFTDTGSGQCH